MTFLARLEARARAIDSPLCVGLDPRVAPDDEGPDAAAPVAARIVDANRRIVDATASAALCYKPNIAFYEQHGPAGIEALEATLAAIPDEIPVILDAKRGDIGATAQAYAAACARLGVDAVTVSPYMGSDSVAPFTDAGLAVFALCRTSNPGGEELQSLRALGRELYLEVARVTAGWPGEVGLVVAGNDPAALLAVRAERPDAWLLAPGIGAQGGSVEEAVAAGLRDDGLGLLPVVARGIANADEPGEAARRYVEGFRAARDTAASTARGGTPATTAPTALLDAILDRRGLRKGARDLAFVFLAGEPPSVRGPSLGVLKLLAQPGDRLLLTRQRRLLLGLHGSLDRGYALGHAREHLSVHPPRLLRDLFRPSLGQPQLLRDRTHFGLALSKRLPASLLDAHLCLTTRRLNALLRLHEVVAQRVDHHLLLGQRLLARRLHPGLSALELRLQLSLPLLVPGCQLISNLLHARFRRLEFGRDRIQLILLHRERRAPRLLNALIGLGAHCLDALLRNRELRRKLLKLLAMRRGCFGDPSLGVRLDFGQFRLKLAGLRLLPLTGGSRLLDPRLGGLKLLAQGRDLLALGLRALARLLRLAPRGVEGLGQPRHFRLQRVLTLRGLRPGLIGGVLRNFKLVREFLGSALVGLQRLFCVIRACHRG
ncbi:MAG: orotidine-5'-phosphate decarboxylase, partial [Spirochaetota bacterium]